MPYEVFISLRYLRAKRRQRSLSVITFISIAGVAVGVMALIVVMAVMSGFEFDLRNKILGTNAHIWVLRYGERGIEDPGAALAAVREVPGVRAASPFTYNEVLLTAAGRSAGTVLRGIDLASAVEATDFRKTLRGASEELTAAMASPRPVFPPEGIVLGSYLASSLGVSVGSPVDVLLPLGGDLSPLGVMPRMRRFTVVGIFQVGFAEFDSKLAMVAIPTAQQLFRMGPAVSGIEVRVTDIYRAAEVAETVRARLKFPYFTRTWMELNRNFFSALRVERIVMFVILTMIVLVAAFGIISTLIMLVMQKRKEIAVLKSMGATGTSLTTVFIVQGMIIGAAGTILGLLAGLSIARNLDPIVAAVEWIFGFKAFPQEVYLLDKLPARILWPDVVAITVTAFVITFLATIIPSRQAARVDPVVAIRYE
ncbi:MAG: ABC transporter permease [candidate division NC10 bacterium RIFCSPLOWO2_12_FULL_66_18]|nr:MAG: ABC transporter permease [candidate division NC10 bacterium RIFCSPLOWO2_02_FULL_66_22]OGC01769.1 MAG: ABC transporter permease [candidate division NC10 bacterium RIFCSPLOWO2_12_FULL_66_18]